jgi:hypothetical protein
VSRRYWPLRFVGRPLPLTPREVRLDWNWPSSAAVAQQEVGIAGRLDGDLTDSKLAQSRALTKCENVGPDAGLAETDLERTLAYGAVLAYELVEARVPEQAVAVLVDVDSV